MCVTIDGEGKGKQKNVEWAGFFLAFTNATMPRPKKKKKAKAAPAVDVGPTSAEVRRALFPCLVWGCKLEQSFARKRAREEATRVHHFTSLSLTSTYSDLDDKK